MSVEFEGGVFHPDLPNNGLPQHLQSTNEKRLRRPQMVVMSLHLI